MVKCIVYDLSPSYCYKRFRCRCNVCLAWKKDAAQRTNNKDRARERSRNWRLNNVEWSRNNSKNYQSSHPEKVLEWQLKKYDLTVENYNKMVGDQEGRCAICGSVVDGMQQGKSRLCIDHDPSTGKVRGLLCGYCNIALGHFKHLSSSLANAVQYLGKEWKCLN